MLSFTSLRSRLFVALLLAALIPSALLLAGGTLVVREMVVAAGSAGPWGEVASSGSDLLELLEREPDLDPAVREAVERHRAHLSESMRLSQVYAFLGERVLLLLPATAVILLLVAAGLALWAAKRFSRGLSRPVGELVRWSGELGAGRPLPPPDPEREGAEIREFRKLRVALRHLEVELAEAREREIREARTRSWTEMARRVAHELKNPLTPMGMAARRVAASADPVTAEAGAILEEEIARLDRLARSFAQFGRMPEGPPSRVDLRELLDGLAARIGKAAPLEVHAGEAPAEVIGHPDALERVVRNLVVNAQEATAEGGKAALEAVRVELRAEFGHAVIRVLDRGPGLPAGDVDRIWEPEFSTRRKGTGLGLPFVRRIVEAHEGRVKAWNRVGGGAEFRIELPLADGDGAEERATHASAAGDGA